MDADASKGVDTSEFLQAVAKMNGAFGGAASSGGAIGMAGGLESTRAIQEQMHKVRNERMLPAPAATTAKAAADQAAAPLIDVSPSATLPKINKIYAPIKYP